MDGLCTIGVDASAKQKRRPAVVVAEQAPVELFAGASIAGRLGVEQEIFAEPFIFVDAFQVFGPRDGKDLDEVESGGLQGAAIAGRLRAM